MDDHHDAETDPNASTTDVDGIRPSWWPRMIERIERLHELIPVAIQDGERTADIDPVSLENAKRFAARLIDSTQPGLFIQHDGLTRLVWQSGGIRGMRQFSEQVAVKFRRNERVDFILFRSEDPKGGTSHIMGDAHVDSILGIVNDLGLKHVMSTTRLAQYESERTHDP